MPQNFTVVYLAIVSQHYGGVEQKIIAQADALVKNISHILYLICSLPPSEKFASVIAKRSFIKVLVNDPGKLTNPYERRKEKFRLMSDALSNHLPSETIVFLRYPNADFLFLRFLRNNKRYSIVTEHNDIETTMSSYKLDGKFIEKLLETVYGRKVRQEVAAVVGVTREITDFELKKSGDANKNALTVGNGVNVNLFPRRTVNNGSPELIKLLFVGGGYRHHGLDRLLKGIADFNMSALSNNYQVVLKIIGESNEMRENIKLAASLGLDKKVTFFKFKNPEELNKYFNWADVGVGSLGLHRIGLSFGSNLKAREYVCRGLPFFSSVVDEDLLACSKYVLKVDANEEAINIQSIIDFALQIRTDDIHPERMRDYAINHLDWNIKMKNLINLFKKLHKSSKDNMLISAES